MYGKVLRASWVALFLVLCSALSSWALDEARDSPTSSTGSGQLPSLTTPTDSSSSDPVLDLWLEARRTSLLLSETLSDSLKQIEIDRQQKILDDAARKSEREDSARAYSLLFSRVVTLQDYWTQLSTLIGNFEGSEAERQKAALSALDNLKTEAQKQDAKILLLQIGVVTLTVSTVVLGVVVLGYAVSWW